MSSTTPRDLSTRWPVFRRVVAACTPTTAGIAEGKTVTLIARAVPEIPDYFVVRKSNGGNGPIL